MKYKLKIIKMLIFNKLFLYKNEASNHGKAYSVNFKNMYSKSTWNESRIKGM